MIPALLYLILNLTSMMVLPDQAFFAQGMIAGNSISAQVDHPMAKMIIEECNHPDVIRFFNDYKSQQLTTETLADISRKYSVDVASLYLVKRLHEKKGNHRFNQSYDAYFDDLKNGPAGNMMISHPDILLLFVPGFGYKSDTTTGADFRQQRLLLENNGFRTELIETDEWGLVDQNAEIITEKIKDNADKDKKMILVSASKGGLETLKALNYMIDTEEASNILGWISVGGILKGSPIADQYLNAPKCWLAEIILWTKGKSIDLVEDMSYEKRKNEAMHIPEHIRVIHYVGIPLSSTISKEVKKRYQSLLDFGPNDGLTPLADELLPDSYVVTEIGLDHYFRDPDIELKTLALTLASLEVISDKSEKRY